MYWMLFEVCYNILDYLVYILTEFMPYGLVVEVVFCGLFTTLN